MKKTKTKSSALVCTLGLAMSLAGGLAGTARAQAIPTPDNDAWYTPPAGYQSLPNGSVLNSRQIDAQYLIPLLSTQVVTQIADAIIGFTSLTSALDGLTGELQNLQLDSYQVLYKSTDSHGQAVADATTIIVPHGTWQGNGQTRPLVAFETAEDSVSNTCEPSYTIRTGLLGAPGSQLAASQFEVGIGLTSLIAGYAVAYADYEGPDSQWIAGPQEGHAVLDGATAVLSFMQQNHASASLTSSSQVGLWGYSGGGGAAGWAAALRATYAPNLNVVGAAVGAPSNGNVAALYNANNGKLTEGLLPMAVVGLNRAYPEAGIDQYLNPAGTALLASASASGSCTIANAVLHAFIGPMENYTIAPWVPLPSSAPGKIIFPGNSLDDQTYTPNMPVLSYNDVYDGTVPIASDNDAATHWCQAGANVEVMHMSTYIPADPSGLLGLGIHVENEIAGALPAFIYLMDRFNGNTQRNDCPSSAVWSAQNKQAYHAFDVQ